MKKTDSCEEGQLTKTKDSAARLQNDADNLPKPTTWDEWFDEEKCSSDFMGSREQS